MDLDTGRRMDSPMPVPSGFEVKKDRSLAFADLPWLKVCKKVPKVRKKRKKPPSSDGLFRKADASYSKHPVPYPRMSSGSNLLSNVRIAVRERDSGRRTGLLDKELERKLAAHLFNETWRLIEKPDRTPEEDVFMIHSAHASRYHWQSVGDSSHKAIGEWQISRVYSLLSLSDPALYHARLCLGICETQSVSAFLRGCAHEAMARAFSFTDKTSARLHHQAASELAVLVQDPEDRSILESDLRHG
jgi:hypothetical protein